MYNSPQQSEKNSIAMFSPLGRKSNFKTINECPFSSHQQMFNPKTEPKDEQDIYKDEFS